MGFRFRRSMKIMPGVRLNLSKSGVSASLGPRGLKHTIGPRGSRTTVGLPGSGLSHTTVHKRSQRTRNIADPESAAPASAGSSPIVGWAILGVIVLALFLIFG